jgi:hypothetical protein
MLDKLSPLDRSVLIWPLIIFVSALVAAIAVFARALPLLRNLSIFWFLLVCPGMSFVRLLVLKDLIAEWVLAVALSLSLEIALALVMIYTHWWQPGWGLIFLITLSLIGAVLQLWKSLQEARNRESQAV